MGAINFAMSDIYGGYAGTTETTIPEADDQKALVDDQKASDIAHGKTNNKKKIFIFIILILVAIVLLGGRR